MVKLGCPLQPLLTMNAGMKMNSDDKRYRDLVSRVADLASPTGQWPEAIHTNFLEELDA
jgi:hypothetical protein